jgi:UrcA family protein
MLVSLAMSMVALGAAEAALPPVVEPNPPRVAVSTRDLDLSRTDGAQTLLRRLRQAASEACGGQPSLGDLAAAGAYRTCMTATMDAAVASVHAPVVTALYQGAAPHAVAAAGGPG